jgi:ribonuclease HI
MPKRIKFYAVRRGHKIGVFTSWNDCLEAVYQFPSPSFRAFYSRDDALFFVRNGMMPITKNIKKTLCPD